MRPCFLVDFSPSDTKENNKNHKRTIAVEPSREQIEKERTNVNVTIACDELESIKAVTRIDKNASALLSAARIGRDVLAKSLSTATI